MRFFVDERALTLPASGGDQALEVIEAFLEVVEAMRPFGDERISRSDMVYDQMVLPDVSLVDFLFGPNLDPAWVEARRRLGIALGKMANWEEDGTPDALEVDFEGASIEAPTLAWAWARRGDGHAVACLAFASAGPTGARRVALAGVARELHFVSRPKERVDFLRSSLLTERLSADAFSTRAVRAFPNLLWRDGVMQELRTHKASFFDDRLDMTVRDLSVLDEHGAAIFHVETEQSARAARLAARGVDASSESGNAKGFAKAVKDHTRTWRGGAVQFWWHTKLTHNDGRIHFLHEPPGPGVDPNHPHGRIVIGIFADHLIVSGTNA